MRSINTHERKRTRYIRSHTHPWWRHQMEPFSALLALCAGNSPVPVNSLHKGQWRGVLMFSLMYVWINDWVNNREAGDLRRHRTHNDVIVMKVTVWSQDGLTYWGLNKMSGTFKQQITFQTEISWMLIIVSWLKVYWHLFQRVQLKTYWHWLEQWLGSDQKTSYYLKQCWPRSVLAINQTNVDYMVSL